jgi:uncharacterized protein
MKLPVDRLTATPTPYAFEADGEWWAERAGAVAELHHEVVESFRFEFKAHMMGSDLFLDGKLQGLIELECSRCLARYRQVIREVFQLVLEPAGDRQPLDPEAAACLGRAGLCLGDDLDSGWYRGSEIALDELFGEVIALSMPIQPVCDEDCAGLCPRCGVDRNASVCGCEEELKPTSPFAALAPLREGGEGGKGGSS